MIDEQLAPIRVYRSPDVVEVLNIPPTWLKRWVTDRRVPHQRSGNPDGKQQRGVWFTWGDILAIGAMLPELMTPRQARRDALANGDPADSLIPDARPSDEEITRWAQIVPGRRSDRPAAAGARPSSDTAAGGVAGQPPVVGTDPVPRGRAADARGEGGVVGPGAD